MGHGHLKKKRALRDFPAFPEDAVWMVVLGLHGSDNCKANGDRFEAAVRRHGKPFVLADEGVVYAPGDIPVAVLYTKRETMASLLDMFVKGKPPIVPLMVIRSNKNGGGWGSQGAMTDEQIDGWFKKALDLRVTN